MNIVVKPILPGSTIGILGGGQLARMLALAARPMGYHIVVLDPDPHCPAAGVSDSVVATSYDDAEGLARLAAMADVVTLEFENVPSNALAALESVVPVRPGRHVLEIARDRILEKTFLNSIGIETAPWAAIETEGELAAAVSTVAFPAIIKTSRLGYDGKGQFRVANADETTAAWQRLGRDPAVIESLVDFTLEISVIVARSPSGEQCAFAPFENEHCNSILDLTSWPARISADVAALAIETALAIARDIDAIGLLTVEMFVVQSTGAGATRVIVNELAPRPHNSGHVTIEAARTSQFAQAIRAVCGLPLGDVSPLSPGAMANVLGDLWTDDPTAEPNWLEALGAGANLHLYGKREARSGRKMGHLTALGATVDDATAIALAARRALKGTVP